MRMRRETASPPGNGGDGAGGDPTPADVPLHPRRGLRQGVLRRIHRHQCCPLRRTLRQHQPDVRAGHGRHSAEGRGRRHGPRQRASGQFDARERLGRQPVRRCLRQLLVPDGDELSDCHGPQCGQPGSNRASLLCCRTSIDPIDPWAVGSGAGNREGDVHASDSAERKSARRHHGGDGDRAAR